MKKIGVMLCGHGSRSTAAVAEFAGFAEKMRSEFAEWPLAYGYLEFSNPVIRAGLDELRSQGCDRILAVPGMLFAAMHAKNDIPSVLNAYAREHGLAIHYGRELGVDPKLLSASADRIEAAIRSADARGEPVEAHETCLVLIGRGASDPDANANVAKVARMLWEGMGFGWCEVGYSGVTFPLVEPCLEHASRLGYKRIIVFPYFLFSGILVDRVYGFTDLVSARYPETEFVKAGYLGDHPGVISTFAERAREALAGDNAMNCALCKYRTQVLGFETEVGLPQESHHHHVEGQGATAHGSNVEACDLCDSFCTGACRLEIGHGHLNDDHDHHHSHSHLHGHGHHHHPPYPQSKHPHGPESARKHAKGRR